ncbi:MAG: LPS export ABC transporter periplasmic protein LptC [Calditrichia bacterium]|nr:LPS export ABC transporter periplasmic protein LptC [Calditrichota bacterium]MCB0267030.1 LPS export ABC transporter periplasmic protein LptC [Calditrichota bacterium]MCB9068668.1 LPS export ABC transporter periplasmic protein LptC [Calditrichia bacterium]
MNRFFLMLTVVAALFFMTGACSKVEDEQSATSPQDSLQQLPDQESWGSIIVISKEGRRFARVWSGYVAVYNKQNQTILKDSIHVDFYNREGQHNSVLTAHEGVVDNQTENLRAMGNVIVISDSGVVLETEELLWDNQKQKIISDVPVKFTTDEDTLVGDSFISDPELVNYEIRNARGYSKRKMQLEKPRN